jgi:hypothetical protein
MRTLTLSLLALISFIPAAWAQTPPFFEWRPLAEVRKYLELSDGQFDAILDQNDRYNEFAAEKVRRVIQVQSEIAEETAREPLDPGALGIRYAEVEAICRELKAEADRGRERSLAALSEPQRMKLKALEEAIKLYPIVAEAEFGNLLPLPFPQGNYTSRSVGVGEGQILDGIRRARRVPSAAVERRRVSGGSFGRAAACPGSA